MNTTSEHFDSVGITVHQPKKGHRYGAESMALADFCHVKKHQRVVELGSGCGVISLIIAARDRPENVTAVEVQTSLHDIAVKNVEENHLGEIVECVNEDFRNFAVEGGAEFDVAVSNPPFFKDGEGKLSQDPERAQARHELNGTINELLNAASLLLVPGGKLILVFPEERREELLKLAPARGFELDRTIRGTDIGPNFLVEFQKKLAPDT